jgi:hypothetical protein
MKNSPLSTEQIRRIAELMRENNRPPSVSMNPGDYAVAVTTQEFIHALDVLATEQEQNRSAEPG